MIKLTYRGISYKTTSLAVDRPQKVNSTNDKNLLSNQDLKKTTSVTKINYYTYRGISYTKLPVDGR